VNYIEIFQVWKVMGSALGSLKLIGSDGKLNKWLLHLLIGVHVFLGLCAVIVCSWICFYLQG